MKKNNFAADMALWENGMLSLNVLKARYPRRDVESITGMHGALATAVNEPAPDPIAGWNEVRSRMASRRAQEQAPVSVLARLRPGLQRRLAFGLAAAVMAVPPVALAANSPEVRDSVLEGVDNIFNIDVTSDPATEPSQGNAGEAVDSDQTFNTPRPGDGQSVGDVPGGARGEAAAKPVAPQPGVSGPGGTDTISSASGGDGTAAAQGSEGDGAAAGGTSETTDGADAPSASPTPTNTATPPLVGQAGEPGRVSTPAP